MEKVFKPVPDVECLKYHGTPEKPDIKIFVSHRIDQDSVVVDNPLYIPVRCGAVYDERKGVTMLGDDTGENISEKRLNFCEYTVMYWAWKNIKADYYGLCHYRRYLSFLDEIVPGPSRALRQGILDSMSSATLKRCGLTDETKIRNEIIKSDMTVVPEYSIKKDVVVDADIKTMKEAWLRHQRCYLRSEDFDELERLIKKHAPEYYNSAREYMSGSRFYGFNCFIMKRELFYKMCEFIFPILFEFEKNLDTSYYSATQKRAAGYLGEWLFSIFIYHQKKNGSISISERQLVTFQNTDKTYGLMPMEAEKAVPIVFSATDANRAMIGVQIQSILEHTDRNNYYDFIILHRSYDADKWKMHLLKEEERTIQMIVKKYPNAMIRFYDPQTELGRLEVRDFDKDNQEEATYIFAVPWILADYDKVIFLQEGVLAKTDIADLYHEDLGDNCVGAVKNIFFGALLNGYIDGFKEYCRKLGMQNLYNYVSTDVLLLDLKRIRMKKQKDNIFSILEDKSNGLTFADKFNQLYENEIEFLPQKWNVVDCWSPDYYLMLDYFPEEYDFSVTKEDACIVNIHGPNGTYAPIQSWMMQLFWRYAKMTPFYEQWLFASVPNYGPPIYDLQLRMGVFDTRSGARKFADKLLPPGTRRREFAKKLFPKGSLRWRFCKQIYYFFKPKYRPPKEI